MTLQEIKTAIANGKRVFHQTEAYEVKLWTNGYHIVCSFNDYAIGLTHRDGVTMNGRPEEFFAADDNRANLLREYCLAHQAFVRASDELAQGYKTDHVRREAASLAASGIDPREITRQHVTDIEKALK